MIENMKSNTAIKVVLAPMVNVTGMLFSSAKDVVDFQQCKQVQRMIVGVASDPCGKWSLDTGKPRYDGKL